MAQVSVLSNRRSPTYESIRDYLYFTPLVFKNNLRIVLDSKSKKRKNIEGRKSLSILIKTDSALFSINWNPNSRLIDSERDLHVNVLFYKKTIICSQPKFAYLFLKLKLKFSQIFSNEHI